MLYLTINLNIIQEIYFGANKKMCILTKNTQMLYRGKSKFRNSDIFHTLIVSLKQYFFSRFKI
jgi:hypothetical protein